MKIFLVGFVCVALAQAQNFLRSDYLPPIEEVNQLLDLGAPSGEYLLPTILADDGYRYKVIRRLRHRQRRDISEFDEYLPPTQEYFSELTAPSKEHLMAPAEEQQTFLGDDGYRYKTVHRHRQRRRRDVSELAQYQSATNHGSAFEVTGFSKGYLVPILEEQQTVLANDGYRYDTVRRHRQRKRRDVVKRLEFVPPVQELDPIEQQQLSILANDGYRYKTVKKSKVKRH